MSGLVWLTRILSVVGCVSFLQASPISVVSQNDGGIWTYQYSLTNDTTADILALSLSGTGFLIELGQTQGPEGWFIIENTDSVSWIALDVSSNITIGSQLSGFSIRSPRGPGQVDASLLLADPSTGEFVDQLSLDTLGPSRDLSAVPEPSSLPIVGVVLLAGILLQSRRSRRLNTW